jgi:hypothetical protein
LDLTTKKPLKANENASAVSVTPARSQGFPMDHLKRPEVCEVAWKFKNPVGVEKAYPQYRTLCQLKSECVRHEH